MSASRPVPGHALPGHALTRLARDWLAEDTPGFDPAGVCVGSGELEARLLCKTPHTLLAGAPFFTAVFTEVGCSVEWIYQEGDQIGPGAVTLVAVVRGPGRGLLLGERPALNCLARASGIATRCCGLRAAARANGWQGEVAGTRKTTPGFRLVEKYAMLVGGVSTHRMDLSGMVMIKDNHVWASGSITEKYAMLVGGVSTHRMDLSGMVMIKDNHVWASGSITEKYAMLVGGVSTHRMDLSGMVMIKDNHVWASGSITEAVAAARSVCGFSSRVEVECRSVEEGREAAAAGADIVMLDNFHPQELQAAARTLKVQFPGLLIEASGGVTPENLAGFCGPHVDVISLGCITQGCPVADFSLKVHKPQSR